MSSTQPNKEKILSLIREHIIPVLRYETSTASSLEKQDFSYVQQRAMINQIFAATSNNYGVQSIMLRLIVIDSLYSTNAEYSYFSFEEMAKAIKAIKALGTEEDAATHFYGLVEGRIKDEKELFSKKYGIRKNLKEGSKQMSLMSKYAYYVLMQDPNRYPLGFPIYDSLAIAMYPKVCENLGITASEITENVSIDSYISLLDEVRKAIFTDDNMLDGYQQFDLLDAYLWRMGKLDNGNYSLLFDKADYEQFIENLGLKWSGEQNYGEMLYHLINDEKLVKCEEKQDKNGNIKHKYKYDFNELVKHKCGHMSTDEILHNVSSRENMTAMITHWRNLYKPTATEESVDPK